MVAKNYFTHLRRLMMTIGIWKVYEPGVSKLRRNIYRVYAISFQLVCYSAMVSLVGEMPSLVKTDPVAAMDSANRFIVYIVIIIKMFIWQSERMVKLLDAALEQNSAIRKSSESDPVVSRIYESHIRLNNTVMSLLVTSGTSVAVTIFAVGDVNLYRFVQSSNGTDVTIKPLPHKYWYPFDKDRHYLIALVDQHVRPTLSCFCIGVISASINSLTIFVKVQLRVLQHQFRGRWERGALRSLKLLCSRHQRLIRHVSDFNQSLKYVILLEYTVSSLTFALLILQITAGEQLTINFTILVLTTLQLLTFSWNSNEIILQSMELASALFRSNWYTQDRPVKVLIHIMMMRCQKPLSLRIAWLGVMDLNAGMSRLKLGYSYTSVVKN